MTREEAIAAGMEVHEIQHSMKRRTPWDGSGRKLRFTSVLLTLYSNFNSAKYTLAIIYSYVEVGNAVPPPCIGKRT